MSKSIILFSIVKKVAFVFIIILILMSIGMIANGVRLLCNFCLGIRNRFKNKFWHPRLRPYSDFFRGQVYRPMPIPTFANANLTTLKYLIVNSLKNRKNIVIFLVAYILRNECLINSNFA